LSGGEPTLHPDLDDLIRGIRSRGMIAGLITNGYLLTQERIERLNRAGLDHLQISIDNVQPDEISMKSLKVLDRKLEFLAGHAEFQVNINSVLGAGVKNPEDALAVTRRALDLGFGSTVGIIHDGHGQGTAEQQGRADLQTDSDAGEAVLRAHQCLQSLSGKTRRRQAKQLVALPGGRPVSLCL
jgi:MoaA/NifB/PqqE/SkfB family radical SAM enzyme